MSAVVEIFHSKEREKDKTQREAELEEIKRRQRLVEKRVGALEAQVRVIRRQKR